MDHERSTVVGGVGAIRPAARRAALVACRLGVPEARRRAVELAVHETLANALEHGHLHDPNLPIVVEVARDDADGVTVRIEDHALVGPRAVDDDRGRGLRLVTGSADAVEVQEAPGRRAVTLRWSRGAGGSGGGTTAPEATTWRN